MLGIAGLDGIWGDRDKWNAVAAEIKRMARAALLPCARALIFVSLNSSLRWCGASQLTGQVRCRRCHSTPCPSSQVHSRPKALCAAPIGQRRLRSLPGWAQDAAKDPASRAAILKAVQEADDLLSGKARRCARALGMGGGT